MQIRLLALVILFIISGCTKKIESNHLIELKFDKLSDINTSMDVKNINQPTVIVFFTKDLNYYKYEKNNSLQEYYGLVDFQGYYSSVVAPILADKKVLEIASNFLESKLLFQTDKGNNYSIDLSKNRHKQGLILFNRKDKPVFWNGNDSGDLEEFIQEYYK